MKRIDQEANLSPRSLQMKPTRYSIDARKRQLENGASIG